MCNKPKSVPMCPPADKAYWPEYFRVSPFLGAEGSGLSSCGSGCKSNCPKPPVYAAAGNYSQRDSNGNTVWDSRSQFYMNAEGFYNASGGAGADIACATAHPFNKTKREQCIEAQRAKRDSKTGGKDSEAELNQAIAEGIRNKQYQQGSGNNSNATKIIIGVVATGAVITGLLIWAKKRKAAKMAAGVASPMAV